MIRIKVFQNGVNRVYVTNSFEKRISDKSETYNFMHAVAEVDNGISKLISFEDEITKAYVFVSPVMSVIEFEKVADE